ncbi:MAG: PilZ domain-containing protein [Planctomycetota bacterium]|nr:PilZ domain-containing protein [Planctomycetota bacterium]MDI6788007.1 PilZ domain-containing protein [Planctomycetota bacterium]
MVLDISQGGLQFISKEKFRKDTKLLLNISAPLFSKDRISVRARVARIKEAPGLKVYGIGVQFIEQESEQTKLKSLIDICHSKNRSEIPDNVHLDKAEKV